MNDLDEDELVDYSCEDELTKMKLCYILYSFLALASKQCSEDENTEDEEAVK